MQAQLIYFKESGKFYTESTLELKEQEKNSRYFEISDRIRLLSAKQQLPGITNDWLAQNGFIVVLQENIGWPILIKHPSNNKTIPAPKTNYQPGKETKHKIKLISFKQHGKYNIEEFITLDEKCIYNNVAIVHEIVDKISAKENGFYYMICAPDDELSGCPHLILPTY